MRKRLVSAALALCSMAFTAAPSYHVIRKIPLGGEGGWDYLTVDPASHRLYVSRGTHVMVADLATNKLIGDIPNTPGVHGIAVVPGLNRGFISAGRANTAMIFDLRTLRVTGEAKTGQNPDAIVYDPASRRVFTFNGRSADATAIDAATGKVAGTIALGGKPEAAAPDGAGKIFVNIEDRSEVVEFDSRSLAVLKRFSLAPCEEPSGIGLDAAHHRVFSGCSNKVMSVLDTQSGKVIATIPIGDGVDGNGYDPATGLAFSANGGDGTLTVARESSPGKFTVVQTVPTQRSARTMALDPRTHEVFLSAATYAPRAAGATGRPSTVPGSFTVLVVGQ
jgi:DNA-binding beta-propeller fold protein YncE